MSATKRTQRDHALLSPAERRTLAALAEGFVPGGGAARAEAAERAFATVVDPELVSQLRLVLRLIERPVASLLIGGRAATFSSLRGDERDAYLQHWVQHRVPLLRSAASALRKLLCFLAYADADEPGDAKLPTRLTSIGYNPKPNAATRDSSNVFAFDPQQAQRIAVDVLVIGSGAGGGSIARDLARAGKRVMVIEAGALYNERTFPTKERDAYERLYLDSGFTATDDAHIAILAGGTVGGGTTVNWMTSIPVPDRVREEWEEQHGVEGAASAAFKRDLDEVLREVGAQPSATMPPKDAAIMRGAEARGWSGEQIQMNRAKCGDCGTCGFGCKRGSKQSTLRLHLPQALEAGAHLIPDCKAERLIIANGEVRGAITTYGTRAGAPRTLEIIAPQVVVSGGALRTPLLLRRSGLTHPAIGQNLRLHPVTLAAGIFPEKIEMWRGTMQAAKSEEFVEPTEDRNGYIIESAPGHPGLLSLGIPWTSRAEHQRIMGLAPHIAPFLAIVKDDGGGSVSETRNGFAKISYRTTPRDERTLRAALGSLVRIAESAGAKEVIAAGSPPIAWRRRDGVEAFGELERQILSFDFSPNRGTVFSAHQMGTARMGNNRVDHACDPFGRVRSSSRPRASDPHAGIVKGLYVADGSLFPTAIGVNPMITIFALAKRVAR
ncbi:MAG: GMC family oxidoreductase N-terminal domain-containing protein, partial [Candidatus Limnocylindrus sp.]